MTKYERTPVVVDVEQSARGAGSMFAAAFCFYHPSGEQFAEVFYFPEKEGATESENTMKFWMETKEKVAFFEAVHTTGTDGNKLLTRKDAAKAIRSLIDGLYNFGAPVDFYSDYSAFDMGGVNSLMDEFGYLPINLKSDDAMISKVIDHTTLALGYAKMLPYQSSSLAFKKLGIEKAPKAKDHDPEMDVVAIMKDVQAVLGAQSLLDVDELPRVFPPEVGVVHE